MVITLGLMFISTMKLAWKLPVIHICYAGAQELQSEEQVVHHGEQLQVATLVIHRGQQYTQLLHHHQGTC